MNLLDADKRLTEGKYELPFRFQMPKNGLPSSMKSPNGLIKYTIEAFTVNDDENLNENRGEKEIILLAPLHDSKQNLRKAEKTFQIIDDQNGDGLLRILATLSKNSYCPGELVSVNLLIENESNQNSKCYISIFQRQIISSYNKQQTHETMLVDFENQNLGKTRETISIGSNQTISNGIVQIRLPNNLVESLESSFIQVKYFVLISIDESIPSSNCFEIPFLVSYINSKNHFDNSNNVPTLSPARAKVF
ncbi:hypothetical protein SSS_07583 [Sarcoptes scabiei]|nr:hypothetical protein SSS_07583 [Sarcoptes scabiei]